MIEVFQFVRYLNFSWALALFFALLYYGVLDILLNRRCKVDHRVRELELWALAAALGVLAVVLSTSEILLTDVPSGFRVFSVWPFLAVTTLGLRMGVVRVHKHSRMIASGLCR